MGFIENKIYLYWKNIAYFSKDLVIVNSNISTSFLGFVLKVVLQIISVESSRGFLGDQAVFFKWIYQVHIIAHWQENLNIQFCLSDSIHLSFTYQHNPRPWGSAGSQVGSYTHSDQACSHIGHWHSLWDLHTHQYLWTCKMPMLTSLLLHVKCFSKELNGSSPQVIEDCCGTLSRMKIDLTQT